MTRPRSFRVSPPSQAGLGPGPGLPTRRPRARFSLPLLRSISNGTGWRSHGPTGAITAPLPRAWRNRALNDPGRQEGLSQLRPPGHPRLRPRFSRHLGSRRTSSSANAPGLWNDYLELHNPCVPGHQAREPAPAGLRDGAVRTPPRYRGRIETQPQVPAQPAVAALMRSKRYPLPLSTYSLRQACTPTRWDPRYFRCGAAPSESPSRSRNPVPCRETCASSAHSCPLQRGAADPNSSPPPPPRRIASAGHRGALCLRGELGLRSTSRRACGACRAQCAKSAKAWVHTGLQTADGRDKPALGVWKAYLARSRP